MMSKYKGGKGKKLLKNIDLLKNLTQDEINELWSIVVPVEFSIGSVIMKEGDIGDSMFLFVSGVVDVTKNLTLKIGKKGFSLVEKSMVKLNSNNVSFFGDMAMFENDTRSATITASADCLLFEIKRNDFAALCMKNPELGYKLIKEIAITLCQRVRKGNQDILKLTTALSIALSK
ncbi:MAG: cyclic nucleotide-binding domain-containing protein [Spirochaetia bacterium]